MDIKRKLELVKAQIASIGTHDDEDLALREAALKEVAKMAKDEATAARARVQAKVDAALGREPAAQEAGEAK